MVRSNALENMHSCWLCSYIRAFLWVKSLCAPQTPPPYVLAEYFFKSVDIKYREVVFYLLLVQLSSFWEDILLDVETWLQEFTLIM